MIIRTLLLFFIALTLVWAKEYDTTVMAIQAKLFPKIALLEQQIKSSDAGTLSITILAIDSDYRAALRYKKQIETTYPKGLRGRAIVVSIAKFNAGLDAPDAIIVLSHRPEVLKEIASWANANRIVSFTYEPYQLRDGFLASIYFGKSAKPYLNRDVMQRSGFVFDPYLLDLSKFYSDR